MSEINHNNNPVRVSKSEGSGFNLFDTIKLYPKKESDELTLQLLGTMISKITQSNDADSKKLFLIQNLLIAHHLYLYPSQKQK